MGMMIGSRIGERKQEKEFRRFLRRIGIRVGKRTSRAELVHWSIETGVCLGCGSGFQSMGKEDLNQGEIGYECINCGLMLVDSGGVIHELRYIPA